MTVKPTWPPESLEGVWFHSFVVREWDDENELRIIHAAVKKYAMRLGDPTYKMTGTEFAALVRTQLLIEGGGVASKLEGQIGVSDEFRERLARLPVYARAMTGVQ